ncbi:cytochrome c oxidase assembly protein [Virgibacillus phasianinus]|uniref:Cytochrome c oxidase assembly protein n=1 Tax=Virgibacillus phasianinus TaxID=2017483 RepID=A0A220U6Q3_9BACI|nr:SCO family protein [Virgibacillus phasianinus]ASK63652.1 cytochrome c oxidase assembly protein [Virgibacillus phasianinus]
MLRIGKLAIPLLMFVLILSACGDKYEGDFSYEVQDFSFTNQDGEKVSKSSLEGKFWVADFVFTNCETVCPPMTANMAKLQDKLNEAELDDVQLVSFSVDPDRDTKSALKEFGKSHGASFDNWHFLTGYEFQTIKEFSIKSFKSALEKVKDSDQLMHGTSFFLVSPEGNAIKRYSGIKAAEMDKIVKDIKEMK